MRDVSTHLVRSGTRLDAAALRQTLRAMADLHLAFWGERFDDLCRLEDRYNLLSPETGRLEQERGERAGELILRSWEHFHELVPREVGAVIEGLANDPAPLVSAMDGLEPTLIHGDLRLNNLGLFGEGIVLVDWGERTGTAPAPVELASFLVFDAESFDVSRDDAIAAFRGLYGDRFDPTALDLALIGGMVQLGCNITLPLALDGGDEARARAEKQLAWWIPTVVAALDRTSPV
jgi:hypothetical protein